ncbi:cytochrome P450 119 [Halalkalicoccus paucihalophilus]|uniref:Cytochrome P450 119 n=1 Tax=Halalkalicoccus paucihalophilus TaxID=1008153 RepID=A0A151A8P6_9EURY|nr:cytochrome P450 [Halalkalicoccus paucihalophilus]KYH23983.1 cytochrome P450 119 [Halalkalicoccus paucihalophilus]
MGSDQPPGLSAPLGIRNLLEVYRDPFDIFPDWNDKYGDFVKIETSKGPHYLLFHPSYFDQVLVEDFERYGKGTIQEEIFEPITGSNSLLLSSGDQWHERREMMQPAFQREQVATYVDTMASYTEDHIQSWTAKQTVAIDKEMTQLSLAILGQTLFGEDIRNRDGPIREAGEAIADKTDGSSINFYLPDWLPTPTNRQFDSAIEAFDRELEQLIREREEALQESSASTVGDDLLTKFVQIRQREGGEVMDIATIRDNLKGLVLGGRDTAALALTYTLYLLAQHPAVADQVYRECQEVLGDEQPDIEALADLEYTDAVINESLRLYPPVYGLFREPREPTEIEGYNISTNATVVLPVFAVQRDERWYEDPDTFDPERWRGTSDIKAENPNFAYCPFGGGPNVCIGETFAKAELKTALAAILREWELRPVTEEFERAIAITAQPREELLVEVTER